jgi:glycosyltransferase involved in cell wall biosynthesis
MCLALRAAGVSPLIATTNADGDGVLDVPLGTVTNWHGTEAIFFQRQWSEAFKYSRGLGSWLERHIGEFQVAHLHGPLSHSSLVAAACAYRHGVPFIVRPLGTLDRWSLQQKARKKQLLMPFVARMLRRAAAVHCTSAEELREVSDAFGLQNGITIPLGVQSLFIEEDAHNDEERRRDPYVLALSRLHPVKNLEALIEAFADLEPADARRGWRLVIGGSGDAAYADALDSIIERRNASAFVTRIGWMSGGAKQALVRGASVFALPSHHENFGVGLVEAMAAGVPALVSGGVHLSAEIERAGAGWVVAGNRESIRAALADAIADTDGRWRRANGARKFAVAFAWPVVAGQLVDLYDRLAGAQVRGVA